MREQDGPVDVCVAIPPGIPVEFARDAALIFNTADISANGEQQNLQKIVSTLYNVAYLCSWRGLWRSGQFADKLSFNQLCHHRHPQ